MKPVDEFRPEFLEKKLVLSLSIYKLLTSLCINNHENQKLTSKYLPLFIMHCFYIPSSFQTIVTIIQNNEEFLLQLLEKDQSPEGVSPLNPKKTQSRMFEDSPMNNSLVKGKNKAVSIEHIAKNPKEQLELIEVLRADFEEKSKKAFGAYAEFYNKMVTALKENKGLGLPNNQDLINFYIGNTMQAVLMRLKQTSHVNMIKKNLFAFLKRVCSIGSAGVNSNQEMIYKLLVQDLKTLDYVFIPIENDEDKLVMTLDNTKRELEEVAMSIQQQQPRGISPSPLRSSNPNMVKEASPRKPRVTSFFSRKDKEKDSAKESLLKEELSSPGIEFRPQMVELVPIKEKSRSRRDGGIEAIMKNVAGQLDFFACMCNGRNYTWKSYLEKLISYNSLLRYLDATLDFDVKANICRLMSKLYVDQEPYRMQILPELCKVVNVSGDNGTSQCL